MDLSSLSGGGKQPEQAPPPMEYTAQLTSPLLSGEVKLAVGEDALAATGLFDAVALLYADMTALYLADYAVTIQTESGNLVISRMGSWCEPFYAALLAAYNKKVLQALFVSGAPLLTAEGAYRHAENGGVLSGTAPVRLFENSVCTLPPDLHARRIPLCFLTGMDRSEYEITFHLDEERYSISKLGYDTAPFADGVEKQLRTLREQALAAVRELDPTLTGMQAAAIAKLMPEGAAAQMGKLAAIAPSFVQALEEAIDAGRAAESYKAFCGLSNPEDIYIGVRKNTASAGTAGGPDALLSGGNPLEALKKLADGESGEDTPQPQPYLLWLIVPSPDKTACAVEFAGDLDDAAATFVYRFDGSFDAFAKKLNYALEAIDFKREVIRLTDGELQAAERSDRRMAVQRNPSLQLVRRCFAGRVIHSGSWAEKLAALWESPAT